MGLEGFTVRTFHWHLPLKKKVRTSIGANQENYFGAQSASQGHKLPSQPILSAIVWKLQSSGRNAPITVVFCNDTTSVTQEVTNQWKEKKESELPATGRRKSAKAGWNQFSMFLNRSERSTMRRRKLYISIEHRGSWCRWCLCCPSQLPSVKGVFSAHINNDDEFWSRADFLRS